MNKRKNEGKFSKIQDGTREMDGFELHSTRCKVAEDGHGDYTLSTKNIIFSP